MSETERKISSLQGSTGQSDIAQRRQLEATLIEQKQELNDTYYDWAKDQRTQALDDELDAYQKSMDNYVDTLRDSLEQATKNMNKFMSTVTNNVMMNAATVEKEYKETGLSMDESLTQPWESAAEATRGYEIDGLALMNQWVASGGVFDIYSSQATNYLEAPWNAGTVALQSFKNSVDIQMANVLNSVQRNVANATSSLSNLNAQIVDTNKRASTAASNAQKTIDSIKKQYDEVEPQFTNIGYLTNSYALRSSADIGGGTVYTDNVTGQKYYMITTGSKKNYYVPVSGVKFGSGRQGDIIEGTKLYKKKSYAKGTMGATKDHWAITDEPQYGDELTLVPNKGVLSYMRKGTSVVPAKLTEELMKIGEVGLNGLIQTPKFDSGINVVSNAINKPEYNFSFENLVHVDNCTEETLPAVQKVVKTELDSFMRKINYSLKTSGAR